MSLMIINVHYITHHSLWHIIFFDAFQFARSSRLSLHCRKLTSSRSKSSRHWSVEDTVERCWTMLKATRMFGRNGSAEEILWVVPCTVMPSLGKIKISICFTTHSASRTLLTVHVFHKVEWNMRAHSCAKDASCKPDNMYTVYSDIQHTYWILLRCFLHVSAVFFIGLLRSAKSPGVQIVSRCMRT